MLAHDGPEGIEGALAYGPDVLLLDMCLPNLDGYEVARQLRRVESLETIPSSSPSPGMPRKKTGNAHGRWELIITLAKPVDIRTIAGLIEQLR